MEKARLQKEQDRQQRAEFIRQQKAAKLAEAEAQRQALREANAAAISQQRRDAAIKTRARTNTYEMSHPEADPAIAVPRARAASHSAGRKSRDAKRSADAAYERNKERAEREEWYAAQRQARLDAAKLEQEERKREFEEAKRLRKQQDEERRLKKQKEIEERKREIIERRRLKQQAQMSEKALETEKIGIQQQRSASLHQSMRGAEGSPSFAGRKSFAAIF